jgi:hypothetical protein
LLLMFRVRRAAAGRRRERASGIVITRQSEREPE